MSASPPVAPRPNDAPQQGRPIVSSGWLAANSTFGSGDRRTKRAFGASAVTFATYTVAFLLLGWTTYKAQQVLDPEPPPPVHIVYLQQPGPGGGGGGSPAPAPPKPISVPKTKMPDPVPIVPPPPQVVTPPPVPTLSAPIIIDNGAMQASGTVTMAMPGVGGGGRGTGLGSGTGSGVGPGTGGGFGGGAYRPGSGISFPEPLRKPTPLYTAEAMRMKVMGSVEVEAVVNPDGTVGDVRVTKSIDKVYGMDQAAIAAARQWFFRPGKDREGNAVPVVVTLIFDLRLH